MSATLVRPDEKHFTVQEIATIWHLDPKTVREMFKGEEGVVCFGTLNSTVRKRAYATLRIPESVFQRVHRRMTVKPSR
jgi:methylphosphotriester-DNA--protein-cysteine methyltransferase